MNARVDRVSVRIGEKPVGTLAEPASHKVAFAYSPEWLKTGFPISPFSLPLENRVFVPEKPTFDGLFGVFADSLPDSWGQLLVDRMLQRRGYSPEEVSPLRRLCIVGDAGMGSLCYHPSWTLADQNVPSDLDEMAECLEPSLCNKIKAALLVTKMITKQDMNDLVGLIVESIGSGLIPDTGDTTLEVSDILKTISIEPVKYGFPGKTRVVKCKVSIAGITEYVNFTIKKENGDVYIAKAAITKK